MADNVAITAGAGTTIAADEVTDGTLGSVKVQFVKIMDGTLDGTSKAAVGTNGLSVAIKDTNNVAPDFTATSPVSQIGVVPGVNASGVITLATQIIGVSGSVAATATTATLAAAASKTTYISGFQVAGGGATAGSVINITVTGLLGGTLTYPTSVPTGAVLGVALIVKFDPPLPASAVNTAIVVNVPSFGAGNTAAAANAQGFQL